MTEKPFPNALFAGPALRWDALEHALGQGGFGISRSARDTHLDRRVVGKKFLPSEIARRRSGADSYSHTAGARLRSKARNACTVASEGGL